MLWQTFFWVTLAASWAALAFSRVFLFLRRVSGTRGTFSLQNKKEYCHFYKRYILHSKSLSNSSLKHISLAVLLKWMSDDLQFIIWKTYSCDASHKWSVHTCILCILGSKFSHMVDNRVFDWNHCRS